MSWKDIEIVARWNSGDRREDADGLLQLLITECIGTHGVSLPEFTDCLRLDPLAGDLVRNARLAYQSKLRTVNDAEAYAEHAKPTGEHEADFHRTCAQNIKTAFGL